MLLAPLLTELLTGNLPLHAFVMPGMLLYLATVAYGFPIILLREFGVRRGVGLLGMLPLGLCYGIVNQGFLAKTYFLRFNVPLESFSQYGFVGGVEIPWAFVISTWHALFAFLFPILIAETLFPDFRGKPWLTKRGAISLLIPTAFLTVAIFFSQPIGFSARMFPHFLELWLLFILLVGVTIQLPLKPQIVEGGSFGVTKTVAGVGLFLGVLVFPAMFAAVKLPVPMFMGYFFALYSFAFLGLSQRATVGHRSLLGVGLGAYLAQAVAGILLAAIKGSLVLLVTDIGFAVCFATALYKLRHKTSLDSSSSDVSFGQD